MSFKGQQIVPAVRHMKDFEKFLESPYDYGVFLDIHIAQLKSVFRMAHSEGKQMLLHADLIQGLRNDEYAAEYLCQELRPFGLISTRTNVIAKAKQKGVLAIQRVFLLDTGALEKSYSLLKRTEPDYIEVLPGAMPGIIQEIREQVRIPIFAGGLVRTEEDVKQALEAGATAVTTSNKTLWKQFV